MSDETVRIAYDVDLWTYEDHIDFEEFVGERWEDALRPKEYTDPETGKAAVDKRNRKLKAPQPSLKAEVATIWIELRRNDPAFTLDDAKKTRRFSVDWSGEPDDPKDSSSDGGDSSNSPGSATTTE